MRHKEDARLVEGERKHLSRKIFKRERERVERERERAGKRIKNRCFFLGKLSVIEKLYRIKGI